MAQSTQNQIREEENPNITFTDAVAIKPTPSSILGDVRAPSTPDMNLDAPAQFRSVIPRSKTIQHRFAVVVTWLVT